MFGNTPVASSPTHKRHALGMPAGSVRALLAFGILGLSWLLVWRYGTGSDHKLPLQFIYLQYLAVLILAHYFASHGSSIGPTVSTRSPLWLPRGTVRLLLVAGYLGLGIYLYLKNEQYSYTAPAAGQQGLLLVLLLASFVFGYISTLVVRLVSGGTLPSWFQDVQAWVGLLALLVLGILAMLHLINSSLPRSDTIDWSTVEAILTALIGFYFGARS